MVKVTRTGFETFVILKTRPEQPPVITVPMSLDGLTVRKEASGQLSLLDSKGEVKAVSPTAIMWSASRHDRVDEPNQVRTVDLQVEGSGSNQRMVLRPDFGFLSDPATVYPVTIDPAATLTTTGLDTFVSSAEASSTFSGATELKVGRLNSGGIDSTFRSFIQFGTSAIVNKTVYSAALYLNQKDAYSCGTSSMWIDRANAFSSTTTWTSQPAYGPTHYYNGSWSGGAATCPYTIGWRSLDVRGLAQSWASSATPVGNMALVAPDETNQDHFRSFYSADSAWPPRIEIEHSAQSTYPAPSSATAVAGNGTATISWAPAPFPGVPPTQYGIALYKEQGQDNWVYTGLAQNVSGTTTSTVFNNLPNDVTYIAQVACLFNGVWGSVVASNIFRPSAAPPAATSVVAMPGAPAGTDPNNNLNGTASVRWEPPRGTELYDLTNYVVTAYNDSGLPVGHVVRNVTPGTNGGPDLHPSFTTFAPSSTNNGKGLAAGTYTFTVTTYDASAQSTVSAPSNPVNISASAPPTPMADAGDRSRFTLDTYQLTDWMTASVNVATGNLKVTATDITLPGVGERLAVGRVYNSLAGAAGAETPYSDMFGYGWRFNLTPDVRLILLDNGDVRYVSPSGNVSRFLRTEVNGQPVFTSPFGMEVDLELTNGQYVLTDHVTQHKMTFDADGDLIKDSDRNSNTYTFSPENHRLIAVESNAGAEPGNKVSLVYGEPVGRLKEINQAPVTGGVARQVKFDYYPASPYGLWKVTDPNGKVTTFYYSGKDLTQIDDPEATTIFEYAGGDSKVTKMIQKSKDGTVVGTTTYDRSVTGHVKVTRGATSQSPVDYQIDVVDPSRISAVTVPSGNGQGPGRTTQIEWDNANRAKAITEDNVTSTVNPRQMRTTYEYEDNNGESLTKTFDSTGVESTARYDVQSGPLAYLPTSATAPGPSADPSREVQLGYSTWGNPQEATRDGVKSKTVVDALGRPTFSWQPKQCAAPCTDQQRATEYTYFTAAGNGYQLLQKVRPPLGGWMQHKTFTYDAYGRLETSTDGNGVKTTFTYDAMDRVTKMAFDVSATIPAVADVPDIVKDYFDDGNLKKVMDGTETTSFLYDGAGRMISKTNSAGSLIYEYDLAGNLTLSSNTPAGGSAITTSYGYNKANELDRITEPQVANEAVLKVDVIGYNDLGLRSDIWYNTVLGPSYGGDGKLETPGTKAAHIHYDYDPAGRLTRIKTTSYANPLAPPVLSDLSYSYAVPANTTCADAVADRMTASIQAVTDNLTGVTTSYCYEKSGELSSAITPGGTAYTYGWDDNSNRTTDALGSRTYNDQDQPEVSGTTFDKAGNMLTGAGFSSLIYNAINQTTSITPNGGSAVPMSYAGTGQSDRTQAGSATQQNGLLGLQLETNAGVSTIYVRDPSGGLIAEKFASGQSFYYYFDGLGSVIGLMDAGGNQRAKYSYGPFGEDATATGVNGTAPSNPWRWVGGYLDDSTGLYHFGERYYDPSRGRFLQIDPVKGGCANDYVYVYGDPINATDLSGAVTLQGNCGTAFLERDAYGFRFGFRNLKAPAIGVTASITYVSIPESFLDWDDPVDVHEIYDTFRPRRSWQRSFSYEQADIDLSRGRTVIAVQLFAFITRPPYFCWSGGLIE